jgi:hypothetical protein
MYEHNKLAQFGTRILFRISPHRWVTASVQCGSMLSSINNTDYEHPQFLVPLLSAQVIGFGLLKLIPERARFNGQQI